MKNNIYKTACLLAVFLISFQHTRAQTVIARINYTYLGFNDNSGDWYNLAGGSTGSLSIDGGYTFTDQTGLPAGVNGDSSGSNFPGIVALTYHYINTGDNAVKNYQISGLNDAKTYSFEFFASRYTSGTPVNRTTLFTAGGSAPVSLNADGNTDNTVSISGVSPDGSGVIGITVQKDAAAVYGYINALIITEDGSGATTYDLTVTTMGNGTVDPSGGSFTENEVVTLTATPGTGYQFDSWDGQATGSSNPTTITMDGDKTVTAIFSEIPAGSYIINQSVTGYGSISLDPDQASYTNGTSVTATANTLYGSTFNNWGGALSGSSSPITFTISSDMDISATFSGGTPPVAESVWEETASYIFVDNGKKIGIGCANPTAELVVDGTIVAKQIDVVEGPCSDYVFEEDYKLISLPELEKYIKANKHLPEVPSAEEFKENGYSVGEMDDLLLRKIEELTLYIIKQQEIIESLEVEVASLQNKTTD